FVRIKVEAGDPYKALLVSERAIGSDQGNKYVLVVKDNKVEYRPVKTGVFRDGLRVITEGVGPDDRVIVNGMARVRPGGTVPGQTGRGVKNEAPGTPPPKK